LKVLLVRSTFAHYQARTKEVYAGYLFKKMGGVRRGILPHLEAKLTT
jgi:hypothetical protein